MEKVISNFIKKYLKNSRGFGSFLLLFFSISISLEARDINLDGIYLKKDSQIYKKLTFAKIDFFKLTSSIPVSDKVIFGDWANGGKIIFLKEYKNYDYNFLYDYFPSTRKKRMLKKISGAVIKVKLTGDGKYIVLKKIVKNKNNIPHPVINIIRLSTSQMYSYKSSNYILDFSVSYRGSEIFIQNKNGIVSIEPGTSPKIIIKRNTYVSKGVDTSNLRPVVSPNKNRTIIVSGGGGSYTGYYFQNGKFISKINSISSISECGWCGNRYFVFRKGYPGFYSVVIYDTNKGNYREISDKSFNTNITLQGKLRMVSYLEDGFLTIYNLNSNKVELFPFEGEDIRLAPDRNRFCVLFDSKLYISSIQTLRSKNFLLKRNAEKIFSLYERAIKDNSSWDNDFTKQYLVRKKNKYGRFIR